MHALVLDGSREGDETAAAAREALLGEVARRGWQADALELRRMEIAPCAGCFGCWLRSPGVCVIEDAGREVARLAARCDMLVLLTRVTFGGYSSELKKAVDRLIPNISPFFTKLRGEVHHRLRYASSPRLLAVGLTAAPDAASEGIFRALVARNAINGRNPAHAAAIIYDGQPPDAVRAAVAAALSGMEAGT
jgi:multimeric flavodoxin WrbA